MMMVDNQNDMNEVVDRCSPDSPEGMMGSHKNVPENQHKTAKSYNKEADSPSSITNYHQDIEILTNEDEGKNEKAIYEQLDTSNFDVNTTHIEALIEEINYEPEGTTCNAENLEEHLFPVDDDELFDEIENDSDLEEPETDKEENGADAAIYHGHDMPVWVSMVMILLHMRTNFVSKHEIEQILFLISAHCLKAHPGLKSLYHFKKHFASFSSPLKKHFYCINCLACVNENANICVNQYCLKSLTNLKSKSYFIELPIKDQLSVLFNRENFTVLLQERFKREVKANIITDVYEGKI
ncbi:unnamed protein product [Mytilus coruscus]|uniref:Uncharacterized protein n=1 Tax=Mytilus coruscus TaxID=42192 RepID=A0A6J8EUU9_MYTCO|nr:unnamed protein product [Mytilus coruscus]